MFSQHAILHAQVPSSDRDGEPKPAALQLNDKKLDGRLCFGWSRGVWSRFESIHG
jgi:hypothetical protein